MNVVIVEDEKGAAEHLQMLLGQVDPLINIKAVLRSVDESVRWFDCNAHPDLGLFDIQLNDGLSFDIFQKVNLSFPIVFTTAFNQYAIRAFQVNSIDYLLKPLKGSDLARALNKFANTRTMTPFNYSILAREIAVLRKQDVFTLLVSHKSKLIPIPAVDFSYFYISHSLLHGVVEGRVYALNNMTVDELYEHLDVSTFFRVNRQCIVNRHSITDMEVHFHSKLALRLNPPSHESIIVSKARVSAFKTWLAFGVQ